MKRAALAILVTGMLGASAVVAGAQPPLREPVEVDAIGLKAVVSDGRVIATWRRYKRDDFASYKLVKSLTNPKPVFPEDPAVFFTDSVGDLRFEDGKLAAGNWHYRLCIVTRFGDRWVSPVVTVAIGEADLKRAAPTPADFEGP